MAGHEVRGADKIWSLDRLVSEAEVGAGVAAGLLRVIVEVGLAVLLRVASDDLDGVLVGADSAVGSESVELALGRAWLHDGNLALDGEGLECHVIDDADGEVVLRLVELKVVVNGDDLGRSGVL